jgi:hypothetical protein
MTYGLTRGAFVEDGAALAAMDAQAQRSTARSWHALDAERRLQLVERALRPANDLIDAFPIAL